MLSGYKTYIVAVLMGALTTANLAGWIDPATYEAIMALLAAVGLGTLRAGITKSGPPA